MTSSPVSSRASSPAIGSRWCRSLYAVTASIAMLCAAAGPAAADSSARPAGDWTGTISLPHQTVRLTLSIPDAKHGRLHYESPLDCSLDLEFVDGDASGVQYALKPPAGGAPGMAPYCNRLLYGRAVLKPDGNGWRFMPRDHDGQDLEAASLQPAARDDRH